MGGCGRRGNGDSGMEATRNHKLHTPDVAARQRRGGDQGHALLDAFSEPQDLLCSPYAWALPCSLH